jgi:hypothetical protein
MTLRFIHFKILFTGIFILKTPQVLFTPAALLLNLSRSTLLELEVSGLLNLHTLAILAELNGGFIAPLVARNGVL